MNENQVPVRAKVWIDRHTDELEHVQQLGETHPVNAALWLAELSEEYASKFDRDLVDDLEVLFPKKEA
jgi:predicted TPR repeat methyltransferase